MKPPNSFRLTRWLLTFGTATFAILTASPLVWMLSASLKEPNDIFNSNLIPQHPTLDNFRYVFTQLPFIRYILNTFFVAGTITVIALLFHSMAGFAFARLRFPGRETIFLPSFRLSGFVTGDRRALVHSGAENGHGEHLCRVDYPGY